MSIENIRAAMNEDAELHMLKTYTIRRWPHTKDEVQPGVERYRLIRHDLVMIDGVAMNDK